MSEIHERAGLVTVEEAHQIAKRYNASHFHNHRDMGEHARYSIPADPLRDDDIRLDAFIARAEKAFAELEQLKSTSTDCERNLQRAIAGEVSRDPTLVLAAAQDLLDDASNAGRGRLHMDVSGVPVGSLMDAYKALLAARKPAGEEGG